MDERIPAHLELAVEPATAGKDLAYRIVNDGDRQVGYGAGASIERDDNGVWIAIPIGTGVYGAWRRDIAPGGVGSWMKLTLPGTLPAGRYRLVKGVHPPFERQGVQPVFPLSAEFVIA